MSYINNNVNALGTDVPLSASATWISDTLSILQYSSLQITIISDQTGTLYYDNSGDGTNYDLTESHSYNTPGVAMHVAYNIRSRFLRLRFVNDAVNQTYFRLITYTNYFRTVEVPKSKFIVTWDAGVTNLGASNLILGPDSWTTTMNDSRIILTSDCLLRSVYVKLGTGPTGANTREYYLMKNPTQLSPRIPGEVMTSVVLTGTDTAGNVTGLGISFVAGDFIQLHQDFTGSGIPLTTVVASAEFEYV